MKAFGSFKLRLLFLVLLVFIPAWCMLFMANLKRQEAERSAVRTEAVSAARVGAASQEYFIKQSKELLRTMTQFPHLVELQDKPMSRVGMKNLKLISPDYSDFGLVETNGVLFSHTLETNEIVAVADSNVVNQAMRERRFSMSTLQFDPFSKKPILQFAKPVLKGGTNLIRVMYGALKVELLSEALRNVQLPVGGTISVLDAGTNVVAHQPDAQNWVGRNLAGIPHVQKAMQGEAVFQAVDQKEKRVCAVTTVNVEGVPFLYVIVSVPQQMLFAEADAEFAGNMVGMLLIGAMMMGATRYISQQAFIKPVNALIEATEKIKSGDLSARTELPKDKSELSVLAQTVDAMAERLGERQAEIERAREELAKTNIELEKRVQERTRELQILNEELEAFAHSVSHDLRAPLRHVGGFAELLLDEEPVVNNPTTQRFASMISKSAKQMGQLIEDLLVFSKTATQSLARRAVNMSGLVDQVVKETAGLLPPGKIEWKIGPLPAVDADAALLRQVWVNLVSNAIKYSARKDQPVIEIGAYKGENELIFWIADNGAGFDMKYAERLFGVFQRLHSAEDYEGTGIGLANIRRIIHRHGGRTWAEGEINRGAKFFFSLPTVSA